MNNWWYEYYTRKEQGELPLDFWYGDKLIMPVMEAYPRTTAQLDSIVADSIIQGRSLEWALEELKPSTGPASVLPDSARREILYYIYRDRLVSMDRPWGFYSDGRCCMGDYYIHGGAGSSQVGWIRFVDILLAEELGFYGFFTVSWSPRVDKDLSPSRVVSTIQDAIAGGILLSYSVNPTWRYDTNLKPCTLFNVPAYKAEIPVKYDYVMQQIYNGEQIADNLKVFVFNKGEYEYLVSMSSLMSISWGNLTHEEWLERFTAFSE